MFLSFLPLEHPLFDELVPLTVDLSRCMKRLEIQMKKDLQGQFINISVQQFTDDITFHHLKTIHDTLFEYHRFLFDSVKKTLSATLLLPEREIKILFRQFTSFRKHVVCSKDDIHSFPGS